MKPGFVDHAIAFTIIILVPILAVRFYRGVVERLRAHPDRRWREYRVIIVNQWVFTAIVVAAWFVAGRDRAALGLDLSGGVPTLIGLAITVLVAALLWHQTIAVRRGDEAAREALRAQLGEAQEMMPRTPREARWFRALAVTAGICEELIYRGFLIAYVAVWLGTWPAVAATAVLFGAAHIYQGTANAVKGLVFSLLVGALYVGCGSLLWPMLVHAAVDLHGGAVGRYALEKREPPASA